MNFPQYEYTVAGFRAVEVYPFTKAYIMNDIGQNDISVDSVKTIYIKHTELWLTHTN